MSTEQKSERLRKALITLLIEHKPNEIRAMLHEMEDLVLPENLKKQKVQTTAHINFDNGVVDHE